MKATFRIIKSGDNYIIRRAEKINQYGGRNYEYFNGYDFMGGANYEKDIRNVNHKMDWDSATATMTDLINAE